MDLSDYNPFDIIDNVRKHEYVYVPDDDSEYGPVWSSYEAVTEFTPAELADAVPATMVANRDGHHGHYLAAEYLDCASGIMTLAASESLSPWECVFLLARAADDVDTSVAYNEHAPEGTCDPDDPDPVPFLCPRCEFIHDQVTEAEDILSELGHVSEWNDGFHIYRVKSTFDPATGWSS